MSEAIANLRLGLGEAAKGSPAKELREVVCQDSNDTLRKEGCPTFQSRKRLN